MSHCNRRKLMINEEEKVAILSLYGLMTEQNKQSAVQSTTGPDEMKLQGKSFFDNGKWKNMSPQGKKELDAQLASAAKFLAEKKGRVVYIKINSGESQVTNSDNEVTPHVPVAPGYLSEKRSATMKAYLTKYFESLKSQGIISQMPIFEAPLFTPGTTPYTKGVDNPNDPKYDGERFVNVELKLQSPEKCVVGLTVEVMYKKDKDPAFPCRGGHTCNEAIFAVKLNGVKIGTADLNNDSAKDRGGDRTSGPIKITDSLAKQIIGNQSRDIVISLQCLSGGNCHSSTPEIKISKGSSVIYWGCSPSIAARGETNEKTILVLDNCGNLKQKGVESGVKSEEGGKNVAGKPISFRTPSTYTGTTQSYMDNLLGQGYVTKNADNTYTFKKVLKYSDGTQYNVGDVINKLIPNPKSTNTTTTSGEKVPSNAKIITVKTTNADTPQVASKKFIDNKFAVTTDKPNVLKIIKTTGYNKVSYNPGDYITLVQG